MKRFEEDMPFREMWFRFQLDDRGLELRGRNDSIPPGAILIGDSTVLLGEPETQPLPILELVRMLVPASQFLVPATKETNLLLRIFPIPSLVRTPTHEG